MAEHFVVIGNGPAGFRAAKAIRQGDSAARISLFTRESHPFYLRRRLGDLLAGEATLAELVFQSRNTYRRERIDLFLGTHITRVIPDAHEVLFASGDRVRYDRLLIATGTEAEGVPLPGIGLHGVVRFDKLGRAAEARKSLDDVRRAVVLDEGIVALALVEGLVRAGVRVTQLVRGERYAPDLFDEETSRVVEGLLENHGVTIRRGTAPRAIVGAKERAIGVETDQGEMASAELVGYGSRRKPAIGLLEGSGIETGRGVRVDERFQTSRPDIFAAGDVAEFPWSHRAGSSSAPALAGSKAAAQAECPFCWQRAWTQGDLAALGMMDRTVQLGADAIRTRATVFGRDLAVIGLGRLPDGGEVSAIEFRETPSIYRRLVFCGGKLVGAVVLGTGEGVQELNRLVAEGASKEAVENALGRTPSDRTVERLPATFAQHCPICAAELVVYRGTRLGATLVCPACSTALVVRWSGTRGSLDVLHP